MPRGTYLTETEKGRILAFYECNLSIQKIATKLNRSRHVVSNFLKNPETYGQNKTGGPKKQVTPRMERLIRNSASNSMASLNKIKGDLQLNISRSTIHRVLASATHLKRQKLKVAPRLLLRHKEARLHFAKLNMNTNWKSVIFSDEKKFNLDGPDGNFSYWRDLRKEPQYFSRRNFGGGSIMVWGAFCATGTVAIAFPSSKMNSEEYIQILENNLLPFLDNNETTTELVFQQDNASVHSSKATKHWFTENDVIVLSWPACSPDLNPIENLWSFMVRKLYSENKQYNNTIELKKMINKTWQEIDKKLIDNLISSMPNRIFELIQKKGGPTKY